VTYLQACRRAGAAKAQMTEFTALFGGAAENAGRF
jgi:hypothetical protein